VGQGNAGISARERLGAVIDNFFGFVQRHPNYPRLMQREIMSRGPNMKWIVVEYYRPLHARLVRLIEEGISSGEFRSVDARNAAVTVVSTMVHYFAAAPVMRHVLGHDPLRPKEVAKRQEAVSRFSRTRVIPTQGRNVMKFLKIFSYLLAASLSWR